MKTSVQVLRGRWRGRTGWIPGRLADRRDGVTKALVHVGDDCELLAISSLREDLQLALPLAAQTKNAAGGGQRRLMQHDEC